MEPAICRTEDNDLSPTTDRRLQRLRRRAPAHRAGPLPRTGRGRPVAGNHGDRLLQFAGLAGGHFRRAAGRAFRRSQCRQYRPALCAGRPGARRLGGARIRRRRRCASSTSSCSATPNAAACKAFAEDAEPLSPGDFIGKWMALMAPAADKVGPRGDRSAGRISHAAGAGLRRQQPRQSDDLPAPRQADRARARSPRTAPISASPPAICRCWTGQAASSCRWSAMSVRSRRGFDFLHLSPQAGRRKIDYAAFFFALISLRLISSSAIWMALSAAPLRRLSETTHICRPLSMVGSVRMRLI